MMNLNSEPTPRTRPLSPEELEYIGLPSKPIRKPLDLIESSNEQMAHNMRIIVVAVIGGILGLILGAMAERSWTQSNADLLDAEGIQYQYRD